MLCHHGLCARVRLPCTTFLYTAAPASSAVESMVVRFNGALNFNFSLYPSRPSQKFRISDAAWTRIAHNVGPTRMTRKEMLKASTTDLRSQVRYPDKIGGGFAVSLETAHRMHCLNLLRKTFLIVRVL
ncbi:hypothetical protein F4604DRAFT_1736496 [Suillus subluteus]|nr:hypothetical protein F4604DRAFT_1736496 [Suillus subluteus]